MSSFLDPYRAAAREPAVLQVLRPDGSVDENLMQQGARLGDREVLRLYEIMVKARILDRQAMTLQRQGRIKGTYAPSEGHEATDVGSSCLLRPDDWVFPQYRQLGVIITRGVPLVTLLCKLMGNSGDPNKGRQLPVEWGFREQNIVTLGAPIGANIIHAVGAAWAMKYRGKDTITMAYFGDGGTSSNDFHSGANFAAVFRVPTVLVCENNRYAISVPVERQTAVPKLSMKALAYGMEGITVDGMDLFAVYKASHYAVEKARREKLPTLLECLTYRFGPHTTADDPLTRYRPAEEVEEWKRKDPLIRLKIYLINAGAMTEADDRQLWARISEEIRAAIREAEAYPPVKPEELVTDVYESVDWHLREEFEEIMRAREVETLARGQHG